VPARTPSSGPALPPASRRCLRGFEAAGRRLSFTLAAAGGIVPWLNWPAWLAANGLPELKPAGAMRFSLYDQVIQATLGAHGAAVRRGAACAAQR